MDLLPSTPFLCAYAVPLLCFSLISNFAGSFLTLDRTRVFPPRYDAGYSVSLGERSSPRQSKRSSLFLLEGGVGGLVGGYLFGLHLCTFFASILPAIAHTAPLSSKSFLAVWILSVIPCMLLGLRWRYAALAFFGTSGGATLGMAICVAIHPEQLTRVILVSVVLPILTIATLLPLKTIQHGVLRLAASSVGAFGVIQSSALLAKIPAWSDPWTRLVQSNSTQWGTVQEKGLTAAFCFFLLFGVLCDWFLRRKFGDNPDEKWDSYLASYAASLPQFTGRAGEFSPLAGTFLGRLLQKKRSGADREAAGLVPPTPDFEQDIKAPSSPLLVPPYKGDTDVEQGVFDFSNRPVALRKKSTAITIGLVKGKGGERARQKIKFQPLGGDADLSSSDSEDDIAVSPYARPWLPHSSTASSTTLHEGSDKRAGSDVESASGAERERAAIAKKLGDNVKGNPDYSDREESVEDVLRRPPIARGQPGWAPGFMRQHRESMKPAATSAVSSGFSQDPLRTPPSSPPATPMQAVPATPSLIRAIERINSAQNAAYTVPTPTPTPKPGPSSPATSHPPPAPSQRGDRWQSFWRDVKTKAAES